jgi:hypothetical protein
LSSIVSPSNSFSIHSNYPSLNITCTAWHEHHMSATYPSCSLALPDTRQRRVRRPHHHQRRSALTPGPLAERTRSRAHRGMRAPPLAFSRASFAVQKDSKYQQAYMRENIAVHLHEYISHACMQDKHATVHLHAPACKGHGD